MATKLQPQTVYVPVPLRERLPEKEVHVIYSDGEIGTRHPEFMRHTDGFISSWLEKQEGVYPLTAGQLIELIAGWDFRVHATVHEYIKSKGIEI